MPAFLALTLCSALLSHTQIPNIISISFDPEGTDNHVRAVLHDIVDKIGSQRRLYRPPATIKTSQRNSASESKKKSKKGRERETSDVELVLTDLGADGRLHSFGHHRHNSGLGEESLGVTPLPPSSPPPAEETSAGGTKVPFFSYNSAKLPMPPPEETSMTTGGDTSSTFVEDKV